MLKLVLMRPTSLLALCTEQINRASDFKKEREFLLRVCARRTRDSSTVLAPAKC